VPCALAWFSLIQAAARDAQLRVPCALAWFSLIQALQRMALNSRLSDSAVFVLEGDGHPAESKLKAFLSASVTLTLGILGSSVLPVPFAFSRLGVLAGLLVASVVSLANALTGTLLLRAAGHLGAHTFETLAYTAAGNGWKVRRWLVD
jgi:hypothetical protein